MRSIKFDILPPPKILKNDVECFRIVEYTGDEGLAIKVSPNVTPGMVFHHTNGQPAIENIITQAGIQSHVPTLFLHGPGIEPSVMNFTKGPYITLQVILKPHALNTLLGLNAAALTNGFMDLNEFSADHLNEHLLNANDGQKRITLLTEFLINLLKQERTRDKVVEESLRLIHQNITSISVKSLLEHLNISQRQFERRFSQTVGISPQSYIRVKRFNEAIRLIKTGQYEKLTDIAYALNFYDQSHLIRDINTFSGITPKIVSQKDDDFYQAQAGYSYM